MTAPDPRLAPLAEALHEQMVGCALGADRRGGHIAMEDHKCDAAAILAALDGWELVPNGSADWDNGYRQGYVAAEAKMGDAAFVSATTRADEAERIIATLRETLDSERAECVRLRAALDELVEAAERHYQQGSNASAAALRAALATAKEAGG
jgi:hypothetical protein